MFSPIVIKLAKELFDVTSHMSECNNIQSDEICRKICEQAGRPELFEQVNEAVERMCAAESSSITEETEIDKRRLYKTAKLTKDYQGIPAGTYVGIRFSFTTGGVAYYALVGKFMGMELPESYLTAFCL